MQRAKINVFINILLALALVMSSMTQFRFGGLPIGYSELIFCAFLLLLPFCMSSRREHITNAVLIYIIILFSSTIPGLFLSLTAFGMETHMAHNIFSYLYTVVFVIALFWAIRHGVISVNNLVRSFIILSGLYFILILMLWSLGHPSMNFNSSRLTGFSRNANQLALHLIVFVFLLMCFRNLFNRSTLYLLIAIFTICASLVLSEALYVSVFVYLVSFMFFYGSRKYGVGFYAPVLGLFIAGIVFYWDGLIELVDVVQGVGDQGGARFFLWKNGMYAIEESLLFGHGPGAWSGIFAPFSGSEAHNTFIDFGTNSGLVGLMVLFLGFLFSLRYLLVKKGALYAAALFAVLAFAFFHFVIRQPLFWVLICLIHVQVARLDEYKNMRQL